MHTNKNNNKNNVKRICFECKAVIGRRRIDEIFEVTVIENKI